MDAYTDNNNFFKINKVNQNIHRIKVWEEPTLASFLDIIAKPKWEGPKYKVDEKCAINGKIIEYKT